jgi:2-oxo-4-hydroxy-4-carboxy-5-ureidoimidazoline decarboxylase
LKISDLNRLDQAQFVAALAGVYEHSPWVAEQAWPRRPFASTDHLHAALTAVVAGAGKDEQLALIRAHPELAGKAMAEGSLTADSTAEQSSAGLTHCSTDELARLRELNARYKEKFGFPFILAVKGYQRAGVIAEFERRVDNDTATEFWESLRQIDKIARLRLEAQIEG